jgi:hypothetical protein
VQLKFNLFVFLGFDMRRIGGSEKEKGIGGRRVLLSFKETPRGSNATFECSPSGPCVPCLYSEKVVIFIIRFHFFFLSFNYKIEASFSQIGFVYKL